MASSRYLLLAKADDQIDFMIHYAIVYRIHEAAQAAQPGNQQTLKLIAAGFGSVGALVRLLSIPFCSGTEAAVKLLGGLAQNVAGMAVEIANAGVCQVHASHNQAIRCQLAGDDTVVDAAW